MVNRPKNKGTAAETMLVNYLREHGWPEAERRTLSGIKDKGDVSGTGPLVWECKSTSGNPKIPAWLAETEIERVNAGADFGILVIKMRGLGSKRVNDWLAVTPLHDHNALRERSGREVLCSDLPTSYSARKLDIQWAALNGARTGMTTGTYDRRLIAVTMMPPGAQELPNRHYRIMRLWEMVELLNAAGYHRQGMAPSSGTSNSQPGSEAPPLARSGE